MTYAIKRRIVIEYQLERRMVMMSIAEMATARAVQRKCADYLEKEVPETPIRIPERWVLLLLVIAALGAVLQIS